MPDHDTFTDTQDLNISTNSCEPEDFFNDIFEDRMFTLMAEDTNNYAYQNIHQILQGQDHFKQIDHHSQCQHARLGTWRDVNSSDIKIFIAHLLVMNPVHKTTLHYYWTIKTLSCTPFLGQNIGNNKLKTYCGMFVTPHTTHHLAPQP